MPDTADFTHQFVPSPNSSAAPTLLLLHGTGGTEHDLLDMGRELLPTANLLSPRGRVLENGMPRFFRRLSEGVFDEADIRRRAGELADFVTASSRRYGFDAGRVIAVGYSNGANIAAALLLLRPGILSGAILLRAMVPLTLPVLPDLGGVRVLIASGHGDPIVPEENAKRLAQMLTTAGAEVTHHWSNAGHHLAASDLADAKNWLEKRA